MSGTATVPQPVPFTDAEKVDVLRFCGYPAFGFNTTYDPFGLYFARFSQPYVFNDARMAAVLDLARVKLAELAGLDAAIVGAGARLSTDSAAVWHRNKTEVADRTALMRQRGRELCKLLGVAPGPDLGAGGSAVRLVV